MDQPASSQPPPPPPPSSSTTENPILAVGRKVKAALTAPQQPSVRILRGPSTTGDPRRRVPVSTGNAQTPASTGASRASSSQPSLASRFADVRNRAGAAVQSLFSDDGKVTADGSSENECDTDTVDLMDVMDPEVATLSTLTNVQNSLFVPSLGRFVNRRPVYRVSNVAGETRIIDKLKASLKQLASPTQEGDQKGSGSEGPPLPARPRTTVSALTNAQYAVLPPGETLEGWTKEDKEELDDLVRHMLHSRRARLKRAMKGFWQYVHRPLGLFVTVYATLVTLFGLAWVLFLIGWISVGSKRDHIINVVDNVLVALFAIIGDGLAPFRAVDTYHMIYIAYYHRKTWKRREKLGLPDLVDHNDLPDQRKEETEPAEVDLESLISRKIPRGLARRIAPRVPRSIARRLLTRYVTKDASYEYSVLTEEEQAKLDYHERKFSKSHTFYKPHETETHYAFPLKLLVLIVVLLDCHSALQISLGACTWGIPYKRRPFALTTVILCCSITCNITGGVLISRGDKRTRKKDVIERMMRQELTSDAMEQILTRRMKEAEERGEVDKSVRKRFEEEKEEAENEEIKKSWKGVPALPKTLLGKGEDHRQPSLPQKARRSTTSVPSTASSSSTTLKSKSKGKGVLPPVQENPSQSQPPKPVLPARPNPVLRRGPVPANEGTGQKVMRLIRRADMDRS